MTPLTFNEAKEKHFARLEQYAPIVNKVHGKNHPEFHQVKDLWDQIYEKTQNNHEAELTHEFEQLRQVTNNYTVPNDVCESYEAVYNMLEEVDAAYQA